MGRLSKLAFVMVGSAILYLLTADRSLHPLEYSAATWASIAVFAITSWLFFTLISFRLLKYIFLR